MFNVTFLHFLSFSSFFLFHLFPCSFPKQQMGKKKTKYSQSSKRRGGGPKDPFPFPLRMWYLDQCDPKRCSGAHLQRMGMVKELRLNQSFRGVVLTPEASDIVNPSDRDIVMENGVAVVDCSWNRIHEIGIQRFHGNYPRKLPFLIAANTTNYGRPIKLNCAEAMAAVLVLADLEEEGRKLLESFPWGEEFFRINEVCFL